MAICRYCGQKAGWFSDAHQACITSAQQGCERVASAVVSMFGEKMALPVEHPHSDEWYLTFATNVWSGTKQTVDKLVAEHRIPTDDLRKSLIEGWSTGAEQVSVAEPLNPEKYSVMSRLFRLMEFTDQEMRKTDGYISAIFSMLLWAVMVYGDPASVAGVPEHPFNLRDCETPLFFFGSVVYSKETVSRSYQAGYGGLSVRLARGMYYHFGGFKGQRIDASTLKEIDYGGMLLTTQNIYFGGDHTTFRIPYTNVVSFRPHSDGIGIFRDSAQAEVFTVLEANPSGGNPVNARPVFGWFLFNMAHFLAQPEAKALYARA
jgi:hypothetical protein